MKDKKLYTVKQWKRFKKTLKDANGVKIDVQELMCQRYHIILTDYKTKKEKAVAILKINTKNLNYSIDILEKIGKGFLCMIDELTRDMEDEDLPKSAKSKNPVKFWPDSDSDSQTLKIWSDSQRTDRINLEKFWGRSKIKIWSEPLESESSSDKIDMNKFWGKND